MPPGLSEQPSKARIWPNQPGGHPVIGYSKDQFSKKEEVNLEEEEDESDGDDLIPWGPHIEHDVANEVVVEGKSCLIMMTIKTVMIISHYNDDKILSDCNLTWWGRRARKRTRDRMI